MAWLLLPRLFENHWNCLNGVRISFVSHWFGNKRLGKKVCFAAECRMQMNVLLIKLNQGSEDFFSSLTTERILFEEWHMFEFALRLSVTPLCLGLTGTVSVTHPGRQELQRVISRREQRQTGRSRCVISSGKSHTDIIRTQCPLLVFSLLSLSQFFF